MFIYLREPDAGNSPSWRLAVRTIEDIIWSVEPRFNDETQTELRVKLAVLRNRVEQAFEDLDAYGTSDNEAHLNLIRELQEEALHQPVDDQLAAIDAVTEDVITSDGEAAAEPEQEEEETSPEIQLSRTPLKVPAAPGHPSRC